MDNIKKTGVVLLNVGTPLSPTPKAVRTYLRQFLSDPRIIDVPAIARFLILNLFILPFRPAKSAKAYQAIWSNDGSPLLHFSTQMRAALADGLGNDYIVELGMNYGAPSIETALTNLLKQSCEKIICIPLFPQYSSAASGSVIEKALKYLSAKWNIPGIEVKGDFYNHSGFIDSVCHSVLKELKESSETYHYLFSYHGLPIKHMDKSEGYYPLCDRKEPCPAINDINRFCYRAQCYETTKLIAQQLNLHPNNYSTAFQSRLGTLPWVKPKWIKPYTDEILLDLINKGVSHLAVLCPSFVCDCLETVEEIGIQAKQQWLSLGGKSFKLVPCLNDSPKWIEVLTQMIR